MSLISNSARDDDGWIERANPAMAAASKPNSAAARLSTGTAGTVDEEDDDGMPYWEEYGWVPCTKSGVQRTPNQIRNELQRYIDKCKADGSRTQTSILQDMGVNGNSFRKFMNPKTYKNQWSATSNGTYWAAAKLLEEERNKPKPKKAKATTTGSNKRGRAGEGDDGAGAAKKKSKADSKSDVRDLYQRIGEVQGVDETVVHDSCPELVKKIKAFLQMDGVTKKGFCDFALRGSSAGALNKFLAAKKQDQAGNQVYPRAYAFFEKKRLLDGETKSKKRIKNEGEYPNGFSLETPRSSRWVWEAAF